MKASLSLGAALLLALAGCIQAPPARPAVQAACSYRVVDLMPEFWAFHERSAALDPAAQAELFRSSVAASHPQLYTAAVIGLPAGQPLDQQLRQRYLRVQPLLADRTGLLRRLSDSIGRDLPRYEARFRAVFDDLAYCGDVYFMHSLGGFDGATRKVDGRTALLFGLDMIAYVYDTDADLQPFFHHELFHLYHAQFRGAGDQDGPSSLIAALWGEGLATYVAQALNPEAGGVSVFGLPRTTPGRVRSGLPALARKIRGLLDSRAKQDYALYFMGTAEDAPVPARSGYYLGYLVAAQLARTHSLKELAQTPVATLRPEIEAALDRLGAGG